MSIVLFVAVVIYVVGIVFTGGINLMDWLLERDFDHDKAVEALRKVPLAPLWPITLFAMINADLNKEDQA